MTEEIGFHMVESVLIEDACCQQSYKKEIKHEAGLQKEYQDLRLRMQ